MILFLQNCSRNFTNVQNITFDWSTFSLELQNYTRLKGHSFGFSSTVSYFVILCFWTSNIALFVSSNGVCVFRQIQRNMEFYAIPCMEPYDSMQKFHAVSMLKFSFEKLKLERMKNKILLYFFASITVFLLPPESGEKISLAITVFLALSLNMLVISEYIPANSLQTPIASKYCLFSMFLVCLSLWLSVLVLNLQGMNIQVLYIFCQNLAKYRKIRHFLQESCKISGVHAFSARILQIPYISGNNCFYHLRSENFPSRS